MKTLLKYMLLLACMPFLSVCGKQSAANVFANKPFALITATDGGQTSISAIVDDNARTIDLTLSKQQHVRAVNLTFQLNPGYTMVSPSQTETVMNLTQPQTVTVADPSGQLLYKITALNLTPILSAAFTFRNAEIQAVIDHETRTISFPIHRLIHASEYPSELLKAVKLDLALTEGYALTDDKGTFDLSGAGKLSVRKGKNSYTYQLIPDIEYLPVTDHLSAFQFKRGVNLTYWMTQEDRNWLGMIMPAYFPLWKELGFDHYRVPVEELCVFNADGTFHKPAIDKLHELFTWCEQNGMYAILDMHTLAPRPGTNNYHEEDLYDPAYPEFRAHFVDVWRRLSAEFKGHDLNHLAYELLNEPGDGTKDASAWNKLQCEVLTAIREQEPERIVLVPAMGWQDYNYIKHAKIAEGDPNAVVSYHYYLPMLLSHYKMLAWVGYQGGIQYPGLVIPTQADADKYPKYAYFHTTNYNAERIMGEIANAAADGKNINRTVHCGEFGCSKQVPEAMRLKWFTDMVAALEANHVPWTLWESLGGGFGFVDEDGQGGNRINCPLLKILTGKEFTESEAKAFLEKYGFKTY